MEIRPIKTKTDYRAALKEIEALMAAERDTPEGERLDVLVTLVEAYERTHYRLDLPDPIEAIKFRMEQKGMTAKDLVPMIGRINRVYEVLSRRRPLTLAMIQRLHSDLGIPAESLIKQPERRRAAFALAAARSSRPDSSASCPFTLWMAPATVQPRSPQCAAARSTHSLELAR